MSESPPALGLVQALAPILERRPVHIILSRRSDELVHVTVQPVRTDELEDPLAATGFSVEGTPEALDAELPQHVSEQWMPARLGMESLLEQIKAAGEKAREMTVGKAKEVLKGGKTRANGAAAQTSLLTAGNPASPASTPALVAGEADPAAAPAAATAAATESTTVSDGGPAHAPCTSTPDEPISPPETPTTVTSSTAGDAVSGLFD
jgi:PRTRC genetic system protein E